LFWDALESHSCTWSFAISCEEGSDKYVDNNLIASRAGKYNEENA
jgi:hypothetical protein